MSGFTKPEVVFEPINSSTDVHATEFVNLLVRLSTFGFSRLFASDQREAIEEICNKVVEDVVVEQLTDESEEDFRVRTFTELFKKLPLLEQRVSVCKIIRKFNGQSELGEIISVFKQLDANDQTQLIEKIMDFKHKNLRIPAGETYEDFRLRIFITQLSEDTDYPYNRLVYGKLIDTQKTSESSDNEGIRKDEQETSKNEVVRRMKDIIKESTWDNWQFRSTEFFFGFSIMFFKGQSATFQRELIADWTNPNLPEGKGFIIEKLRDESDEDFRLRRFTELCKTVNLRTQMYFLNNASWRLDSQGESFPHGMLLQPQDSASAAELLSHLSTFGFSLLSAADQQQKIEQISHEVEGVIIKRFTEESEEDFRAKTFTELFNKVPVITRILFFNQLTQKFFLERKFCEAILLFKQLGSNDQQELMKTLLNWLEMSRKDDKDVKVNKVIEESEEDFRLRRFIKLCSTHPFLLDRFSQHEADKYYRKGIPQTSGNEEIPEIKQSCYAEFFLGLSIIWFKTRFTNDPRMLFQIIFGEVEGGSVIEKLPDENEKDFRLRKFTELFKQLQFSSQEYIVKYIRKTNFHDLGYNRVGKEKEVDNEFNQLESNFMAEKKGSIQWRSHEFVSVKRESASFDNGFIKVKNPHLGGGQATTQGGGGVQATTQGGGGGAITQGGQRTSEFETLNLFQ